MPLVLLLEADDLTRPPRNYDPRPWYVCWIEVVPGYLQGLLDETARIKADKDRWLTVDGETCEYDTMLYEVRHDHHPLFVDGKFLYDEALYRQGKSPCQDVCHALHGMMGETWDQKRIRGSFGNGVSLIEVTEDSFSYLKGTSCEPTGIVTRMTDRSSVTWMANKRWPYTTQWLKTDQLCALHLEDMLERF